METLFPIVSVFIIFSILEIIKSINKNKRKIKEILEVIKNEECDNKLIESKKPDDNMRDDCFYDSKLNK